MGIAHQCFAARPEGLAYRPDWRWRDRNGKLMSQADLDGVQREHNAWLTPERKRGLDGWWDSPLTGADLHEADLSYFRLEHANLEGAILREALLAPVVLISANLKGADMRDSDLTGAILTDAYLEDADLAGAVFEPRTLTRPEYLASARHLELMTFDSNPGSLVQLRKQFQDAGFRDQERAVTYSINRRQASLKPAVERWFNFIAFDLTCRYGFAPGRPLRILFWLWASFSLAYMAFLHRAGRSSILLVVSRLASGKLVTKELRLSARGHLRSPPSARLRILSLRWLRREWHVFLTAMFFSLMSAFNIGFRDLNFGRWLRLLPTREFDLRAVGWTRTTAGLQSLLSLYLVALWVLSYFGRPFG